MINLLLTLVIFLSGFGIGAVYFSHKPKKCRAVRKVMANLTEVDIYAY